MIFASSVHSQNACIHAPSHRVLRQALINLASREVNQTAVILHALEVVEDAILATWQGSQVTRLNVTVNSTDVLLQRVQQVRQASREGGGEKSLLFP